MLPDRRVLALIGPNCNWHRRQHQDAYFCDHCRSYISGVLLHNLKRSLAARG